MTTEAWCNNCRRPMWDAGEITFEYPPSYKGVSRNRLIWKCQGCGLCEADMSWCLGKDERTGRDKAYSDDPIAYKWPGDDWTITARDSDEFGEILYVFNTNGKFKGERPSEEDKQKIREARKARASWSEVLSPDGTKYHDRIIHETVTMFDTLFSEGINPVPVRTGDDLVITAPDYFGVVEQQKKAVRSTKAAKQKA